MDKGEKSARSGWRRPGGLGRLSGSIPGMDRLGLAWRCPSCSNQPIKPHKFKTVAATLFPPAWEGWRLGRRLNLQMLGIRDARKQPWK